MAEYLFRSFLLKNKEKDVCCKSAGIYAENGSKASKNAILALKELGIDLSKHRSRNILKINLNDYDIIAVMNKDHLKALVSIGLDSNRVYILNKESGGVEDPFGGDLKIYRKTRDDLLYSFDDFYKFIKKMKILKTAKIDLARECDLENIYEVERESYGDPWSRNSILSEILNKNSYFVVLKQKSTLLGYACMKVNLDSAEIFKVTTKPSFRNMGIAGLLLENLVDFAKKKEVKNILLEVRESNLLAIELYKNFGFEKIFVRKNFYSSPLEDALTMQKNIVEGKN